MKTIKLLATTFVLFFNEILCSTDYKIIPLSEIIPFSQTSWDFSSLSLFSDHLTILNHKNIMFLKLELLQGRIILFECLGEKNTFSLETLLQIRNGIVGKTIKAVYKIHKNPVGNKLLNKLLNPNPKFAQECGPIIIFSCDFLNILEKYVSKENISNKSCLPEEIKKYLPEDEELTWEDEFKTIAKAGSCFVSKNKNWPANTVLLQYADKIKYSLMVGTLDKFEKSSYPHIPNSTVFHLVPCIVFSDDIILFHELNHARHFIYQSDTYICYDNLYQNASSLKILINNIDNSLVEDELEKYNQGIMYSSEEELQLTGFTKIKEPEKNSFDKSTPQNIIGKTTAKPKKSWRKIKTKELYDPINEIAYRLHSNMQIRFPYRNKRGNISSEHFKLLLNKSLNQINDSFE